MLTLGVAREGDQIQIRLALGRSPGPVSIRYSIQRDDSPPSTQHLAGDPAGERGGEEQHAHWRCRRAAEPPSAIDSEQPRLPIGAGGVPLPLGRRIGAHEARRHVVDRDVPGPSSCASWRVRPICAGLGRGIGLDAGQADAEPGAARDVDDPPGPSPAFIPGPPPGRSRSAPVRLTSKIACQSDGRDRFDRSTDLAEHAARIVDQDDPAPAAASHKSADGAAIGDVDAAASCRNPAGQSRMVRAVLLAGGRRPRPAAPASAKAMRDRAAEAVPAPVTSASGPSRSKSS